MYIVTVLAHPNKESFNYAIANTAIETMQKTGHQVVLHDLYADQFMPVLPKQEILSLADEPTSQTGGDPLVDRYCAEIAAAEGIVIVHPNWWGKPPAMMAGYIDRVFRLDVAYTFPKGEDGSGEPIGLLQAKAVVIFNTSDTPPQREQQVFGDPLELIWKNCIFAFCGVSNVQRRMFSVMASSTEQERRAWLNEVNEMVLHAFEG